MKRLAGGAALTALVCAMGSAVYAQETTAVIRGQIVDTMGAPVAGATVTVTHRPTGSANTSVTGPDGFYSARGLRVGGPYSVAVASSSGQGLTELSAIGVGDPATGDVVVYSEAASMLEDIVVSSTRFAPQVGHSSSNRRHPKWGGGK